MTRSHSWPNEPRSRPSPFLEELGVARTPDAAARAVSTKGPAVEAPEGGGALFDRLKDWRKRRAQADGVPAYVVFHDRTLSEIARLQPRDRSGLASISGIGPAKLDRYAEEVLALVAAS